MAGSGLSTVLPCYGTHPRRTRTGLPCRTKRRTAICAFERRQAGKPCAPKAHLKGGPVLRGVMMWRSNRSSSIGGVCAALAGYFAIAFWCTPARAETESLLKPFNHLDRFWQLGFAALLGGLAVLLVAATVI